MGTEIINPIPKRNSFEIDQDIRRGVTGVQVWQCDWTDRYSTALPQIGSSFDVDNPYLICVHRNFKQIEAHQCEVTLTYSTDGRYGENFYSRTLDFGCEVMNTSKGMLREDTGNPVDVPVPILYPTCDYTINCKIATCTNEAIFNTVGKVNDRIFHQAPAGTLLFLGASLQENLNELGVVMDTTMNYKFMKRMREHNETWLEPRQKMVDSIPQYYQCADEQKPNYTTDTTLESCPVYVDGLEGEGCWTKLYNLATDGITKNYTYEPCNFATVLNLTKMIGDE